MDGRYYSLNEYLKEQFGEKVYKLSLDMGFTCPNRDGTAGVGGCTFCLEGSSHFAVSDLSVRDKLNKAKELISAKTDAEKFIAYFQSYTNTYAPIEVLRRAFFEAVEADDVAVLSIATRPDCLPDEVLELLSELNKIKPVWVELGLQTASDVTAERINRGYKTEAYREAVSRLKKIGVKVITHIIIGLPDEDKADVLNTISLVTDCKTDGVKLQLLHILKGTPLFGEYEKGLVKPLGFEEYMDILFDCIEHLPPDTVIHRITGDPPKKYLASPLWCADKKRVLNTINREMEKRNVRQGSKYKERLV